ncbi:DNA-binding protein [Streptomyces sp. RGM 3693]|uniref:DNA-binding protein n=1 Tax=Streptomyces sp. RGM 3693 TaxID=3413284 RepID=UPI003D2A4EB3
MKTPRTLLAVLIRQRRWRYRDFNHHFRATAEEVLGDEGRNLDCSERTFRRWTGGDLLELPSPAVCRTLERMFRVEAATLFAPPPSQAHAAAAPQLNLEDEIAMTTRDAQNEASAAASTSLSDTTLDQLHDDLTSLAKGYNRKPPLDVFRQASALREEAEEQRTRTQIPAQQQELLIRAGEACALIAAAAFDLGYPDQARTAARAAEGYAETSRFDPLKAYALGTRAFIAYFSDDPTEGARLAQMAQSLTGLGDTARRRLAAIEARAFAYLGDRDSAHQAVTRSHAAGVGRSDDLHDGLEGEFGFTDERLAMSSSSTYLLVQDGPQAEAAALRSLELASRRPVALRSARVVGGAAADLAAARLLRDDLAGAVEALEPLWAVPQDQRSPGLLERISRVHKALASQRYRLALQAGGLREQIQDFAHMSPARQLKPPRLQMPALEGGTTESETDTQR